MCWDKILHIIYLTLGNNTNAKILEDAKYNEK